MSVAAEITRLQNAKASLKSSINAKTDVQHQIDDETIDEYADFVDSISSGGGADLSDYFTSTIGEGTAYESGYATMIKNIPSTTTVSGTSLRHAFSGFLGTTIPLIDTSNVTDMYNMFSGCSNLTTIPLLNTSNVSNMTAMFSYCSSLTTVPLLDTSSLTGTNANSMFNNCTNLTTIPILNMSNVTRMQNMFSGCPNLTDTSLDNILQTCINSNVSTTRKKLSDIGLTSDNYPVSRIQALPHYQDFIDAGWTIGY